VLPPSAEALVRELTRLPGVGRRSAQRLAVHLLRVPEGDALALATAIEEARARIQPCPECFGFAEDGLCPICRDTRRDETTL
jgi:recombination protein RecR